MPSLFVGDCISVCVWLTVEFCMIFRFKFGNYSKVANFRPACVCHGTRAETHEHVILERLCVSLPHCPPSLTHSHTHTHTQREERESSPTVSAGWQSTCTTQETSPLVFSRCHFSLNTMTESNHANGDREKEKEGG